MPRPRSHRRIQFEPNATFFKPQGIPLRDLEVIEISHEEMEAIKLKYQDELQQIECAKKMQTSQSTFQRILTQANQKIADALTNGKAIKIIK